jgi:hypothetical protein
MGGELEELGNERFIPKTKDVIRHDFGNLIKKILSDLRLELFLESTASTVVPTCPDKFISLESCSLLVRSYDPRFCTPLIKMRSQKTSELATMSITATK